MRALRGVSFLGPNRNHKGFSDLGSAPRRGFGELKRLVM